MVLDLVESTELKHHWDYRRKVWENESYTILEFKVEARALPYVVPVLERVLGSMGTDGKAVVSRRYSLSLFGCDKELQKRLMERWFPPDPATED